MDSRRWRRATVLAVDDQPANLVALDAVLSPDFDLVRALSGEQALEILQARDDIDVVLMDVQMPGMDGFETASKVKQLQGCRDLPIVFITAVYHEDPFVKQGYQVGAVDYFSKPFDPEILKVKVAIYASFRQKSDLLKEWERLIHASEGLLHVGRQYSAMLEELPTGVFVLDSAGRIRSVSGSLDPEAIAQVMEHGQVGRHTCDVRGVDGSNRSLLCTASPLQRPDGTPDGIALIVRDVTERNRVDIDLERGIAGLVSAGAEVGAW